MYFPKRKTSRVKNIDIAITKRNAYARKDGEIIFICELDRELLSLFIEATDEAAQKFFETVRKRYLTNNAVCID